MPELWRKIEARQFFLVRVEEADSGLRRRRRRNLPVFGNRSAGAGQRTGTPLVSGNYVDVLADANPAENLSAVGIRVDYTEPNGR